MKEDNMKQGWEIKKLGEVGTFQRGGGFLKSDYVEDGFPCIHYGQIHTRFGVKTFNHLTCIPEGLALSKSKIAQSGDIIIAITSEDIEGSCKCTAWMGDYNVAVGGHAAIFRHTLNPAFVAYYFKGGYFQTAKKVFAHGSKVVEIKPNDIATIKIAYPPLPVQERIVSELDLLSGIIEKKREQLKELDALAQSIFYDMFGDPITNEKGWEVKKVIDIVKMQRGFDLPVQDRDNEGAVPIYGANGVIGKHSTHKAESGIITGRSGTLGEVYSSDKPFWPLNTTLFSADTHGNNVIFLKYLMSNFHLERFKAGAGVPTLNRNEFHNEIIPYIPLPLQHQFATKIEAIERQKELIMQSISETETLFNARMQHYFG